MERKISAVKTPRRYDSTRRRQQANQARQSVVEVARRLFLADGYTRTTVSAIAEAAGVSVETVYKAFGGKAGVVRAIWAKSLEGAGQVSAEQRSDEMQAAERDPRQVIRNWGRFIVEVAPLVAPILLLTRSAAGSDPQMAMLLAEADEQRLRRMERNARTLHERGNLRPDMTLDEARDILWIYSSPELFELLVVRKGWSVERFASFVAEQLIAALLP
jgi:AcrR family transcriptional regulator